MSEKQEYTSGRGRVRPAGPMGGHPGGTGEKARNLTGTWKKLLGYCRRYLAVFVIALVCAAAGTVLTLIGPDKLSEITDTITAGIAPDTEKLEEIVQRITENMAVNRKTDPAGEVFSEIEVDGVRISGRDQAALMERLSESDISGSQTDPQAALETLDQLPEPVYRLIRPSADYILCTQLSAFCDTGISDDNSHPAGDQNHALGYFPQNQPAAYVVL